MHPRESYGNSRQLADKIPCLAELPYRGGLVGSMVKISNIRFQLKRFYFLIATR
jgi:hypothetical protein